MVTEMLNKGAVTGAQIECKWINRSGISLPLIIAACLFPFLINSILLRDGDTYWHIVVGEWIIDNAKVPALDIYSFTKRGEAWYAHEWLSEVLYALAYRLAGWTGVVALAAMAFACTMSALNRVLLRFLVPIYAILFTAAAGSLTIPHLMARPHVLVWPVIVLWCGILLRARTENRAPRWYAGILMVYWANAHGSFPLGLVLAVAFCGEALGSANAPQERWRAAADWSRFILLALLATLVTPHGWRWIEFVIDLHNMSFTIANMMEWQSLNFRHFQPFEFWLLFGGGVILARGLRLPLVRLFLIMGLLHFSLKHARHVELFGLLAPMIVAEPFTKQWISSNPSRTTVTGLDRMFEALTRPARFLAVSFVAVFFFLIVGFYARSDAIQPPSKSAPVDAIRVAREYNVLGPVLNEYGFGGYLIYAGVAPYIDGRADLYGDRFIENYAKAIFLTEPERFYALLKEHKIGWTLIPPHFPVIALLDKLPGWRRLHSDSVAVVHVRVAEN